VSTPPFVFSLERVREVRAHEEDLAREAFATSLSLRARGVAMLADAQARAAAAREQAIADTAPRTGAALLSEQAWLERVQRSQEQAALELDRRQVLDRLKDRKRQAHQVDSIRRDAVALDEIAINGHVRRLAS
jgi:flagellar FliJ protein